MSRWGAALTILLLQDSQIESMPERKSDFRHVVLDADASQPELEHALSLLLLLDIATLSIHAASALHLFGPISVDLPLVAVGLEPGRISAFRLAAASILDLTLVDLSFDAAAPAIPCFKRLRHLTIRGIKTFCVAEGDGDRQFLAAIKGAASLERLTLNNSEPDARGVFKTLPVSWDHAVGVCGPAMKSLEFDIGRGTMDARDWRFIEGCAQSIQALHVTMGGFDKGNLAILGTFTTSPLTSLSLTFTSYPHDRFTNTSPLGIALDPHIANLSSATITAPHPFFDNRSAVRDFCSERHISLRSGRRGDVFVLPRPTSFLLPPASQSWSRHRDVSLLRRHKLSNPASVDWSGSSWIGTSKGWRR